MVRNGPIAPRGRSSPLGRLRLFRRANRRVRSSERSASVEASVEKRPVDPAAPRRSSSGRARYVLRVALQVGKALGALCVVAGLAAVVLFGYRFLMHSPHFAVSEIRVSPTHHVSAEVLRARAGIEVGENLFRVDLDEVTRALLADPWVVHAKVRRELPGTIFLEVSEREPACVVAFGPLYLADAHGEVFKRATPAEAAALPVVTGVPRDQYVDDRENSQALLRDALAALSVWNETRGRPTVGEVHVDVAAGVTLYTASEMVGVRIGRADGPAKQAIWRERLARYDTAMQSLKENGEKPRLILVDQRNADRVTIRLAAR